MPLLEVVLNGSRDHPRVPRTPGEITKEARASIEAGARVLVEPLDADPKNAVAHAAAMEEILAVSDISLEQVHHGDGLASWAVNERGLHRGHGIRTGLEDTPFLPDGQLAPDNAALVCAAAKMIA